MPSSVLSATLEESVMLGKDKQNLQQINSNINVCTWYHRSNKGTKPRLGDQGSCPRVDEA